MLTKELPSKSRSRMLLITTVLILAHMSIPGIAESSSAPTHPPFGVNGDWDYVDLVKTTVWSPNSKGLITYDTNGWPTSDVGATTFVDARHNMAWNGPDWVGINPVVAGNYYLSFTGQAVISVKTEAGNVGAYVDGKTYNPTTNQTTAFLVLKPGYFLLQLTLTKTKRQPTDMPGTGFTNAVLLPPGYPPDTTQVFTTETLNAYKIPIAAVRVPDGMNDYCFDDNDSLGNCFDGSQITPTKWADRVLPTDAVQGGLASKNSNGRHSHGQAWEYIIMFANAIHRDIWINIPINADDEYVSNLAALLKNGDEFTPGLDPGLHVYVEYSNEVWNGGYLGQYVVNQNYAQQNGFDINSPDFYYTGLQEQYVMRQIQIAKIFEGVWGENSLNNQIRMVAQWQYTTETQFQRVLEWAENKFKQPPSKYLYGIGEAAYYNPSYSINVPLPNSQGQTYTLGYPNADSVNNLFNYMWTGSDLTRQDFIGWKAVATYFGLKETAYEAGPSLLDGVGATAARDPRMAPSEVHHFLDNWYAVGGDVANYTSMRGGVGAGLSGSWFLVEYFNQTHTPRMDGALQIMASPEPAYTAGHVLPWSPGQKVQIDPSQRVPDEFSNPPAPGSGLNQGIHSWDGYYDEALYLLRGTGTGRYLISLFGHTDDSTALTKIKVDDHLLTTLTLPVGTDGWSTPVSVQLTPGFHTLLLEAAGGADGAQSHLPAGTGTIQIMLAAGSCNPVVPSAPTNVSTSVATVNSDQVALLWAPETTAQSYNVKRSPQSGGPYTTVGRTTNNMYTDNVPSGKPFYYVITAVNAVGESALSQQTLGEATAPHAPDAPTGLTAQGAAGDGPPWLSVGSEVKLSWKSVPDAVAYNIYISTTSGGFSLGNPETTLLGTEFLDYGEPYSSDLGPNPPGQTFYYAVTAVNTYGESQFSSEATVTPIENIPPAPTGLTASTGNGQVNLKWEPVFGETPSLNAQYNVKRSTKPEGPYSLISSVASPNFIDITAVRGTEYYYVISAVKSVGESPNSSEVSGEAH
jgi:fibronectin type 3 domain-containing protein